LRKPIPPLLGVGVLCIVRWIPFFGSLVVFFALLLGLGSTLTAMFEWRRRKKTSAPATPGPASGPGTPYVAGPIDGAWQQQAPGDRPPGT
jgi:hypothetical protein